jgi:hypothetical protein
MAPEPSLFFQMKRGEHLERATRDLEALSRRFPDTYAAAYADLALGISQSQSAFDPQTKSFREPDCQAAASRLARALPSIADPLTAARGTGVLVECLTRLGRGDEARAAARGFYDAHPEARTLPGISATVDRAPGQK